MRKHNRPLAIFAFVAAALVAAPSAFAQNPFSQEWGGALSIGGGATGFTNEDMRSLTDPGGAWGVRLAMGSRSFIGGELGYSGTVQNIEALGLDTDANLMSNGLDGSVRLNLIPNGMVQPYVTAGVGWRRYDILSDTNTSALQDEDNVLELPASAGVAFKLDQFLLDARATFRSSLYNDLVDSDTRLHNWGATINAGYEF